MQVCVITGGAGGMGWETAKIAGKKYKLLLVDISKQKLRDALSNLQELGIEAESFVCDTTDRKLVEDLAQTASNLGKISAVVHTAGVSPHMTDANTIFRVNAIGTVNINETFGEVMSEKGCILNVASMSAYMLPEEHSPYKLYELAFSDIEAFEAAALERLLDTPADQRGGSAYVLSKNFVKWYTTKMALRLGRKEIRVVSISPGTINTPMGKLEGDEAASYALSNALGRLGEPEEIAQMISFMIDDLCSYLTGVDILYDGGSIAAIRDRKESEENK